jgi:hypothetical protein
MMRRTALLLATMALTLIAAGGIALAATLITCSTNPCDGTIEDDVITGTLNAETINGKGGADQISAQDGNDTINGEDGNDTMHGELGTDRLNGGAGDDQLDGGGGGTSDPNTTADYYYLTTNWGKDTLTDATGTDYILPVPDGGATAAAMPNLIVNLVSGTGPEVTDGNGNTVDWNDNVIEGVLTGAGDDVISQSPTSNGINGGAGSDTYTGYTTGFPGSDSINDPSGTADVLDLSSRNLATTSWRIFKVRSTDNVEILQLEFFGGGSVLLSHYFDNTSTDVCASKPGPGQIETIKFADDRSLDFAQVRSLLGCPPLETAITSMTMEPSEASTKTTFRFSSNDDEATFECKLDGGTFDVCTSPKEYPGLIEGSTHTFEVRAVDPAGNTDPTSARRTWTVDTTPPKVNGTNPINNATSIASTTVVDAFLSEAIDRSTLTTSTFTLTKQGSSTPVSARVEYLSNPKALLTPSSVLEANTTYTATVKGGPGGVKDLAGNPMAQDYTWTFTTAGDTPETTLNSSPSDYEKSTSASFSFSSSEVGSTFQCSRDGSAFSACTSPKSYSSLSQGKHTFEVKAVNFTGKPDPSPASRSWFVDTAVPRGTVSINGGAASTRSQSVTLSLSASDPSPASGVVSVRFRNENTTTWSEWLPYSSSEPWQLSNGAGTKTVYAQFQDRAGNVSATASDKIKFSP